MRDDPRIERHIGTILAGSGLPMDRRAEVAEELRGHLNQSIAGRCESGLSEQEALASALDEFGSPDVIRRQLRRQQRMLDRRQASAKVRRSIWYLLAWAAAFAILLVACSLGTNSSPDRSLAGIELFVVFFLLGLWSTYISEIFNAQVERRRPRSEHAFFRSSLRWMAVVTLTAISAIPFVVGIFAACAPLLAAKWHADPHVGPATFQLLHDLATAWMESAGRNFGLCAFGVIFFGLGVALYERSRCVDEPDIPAST